MNTHKSLHKKDETEESDCHETKQISCAIYIEARKMKYWMKRVLNNVMRNDPRDNLQSKLFLFKRNRNVSRSLKTNCSTFQIHLLPGKLAWAAASFVLFLFNPRNFQVFDSRFQIRSCKVKCFVMLFIISLKKKDFRKAIPLCFQRKFMWSSKVKSSSDTRWLPRDGEN